MLSLAIVRVALLMSLAFGGFLTVFSGPLAAQTQQAIPTSIPDLSGYDPETRQSMEIACVLQKSNGPVAYGACLTRHIASLQNSTGIPDLSSYDSETRQSMEIACVLQKSNGPVAYGACLTRQIASLQNSTGIPDLSGYDSETRQSMEIACVLQKSKGPVAYGACLSRQIASLQRSPSTPSGGGTNTSKPKKGGTASPPVNARSRFTPEKIMKVHEGMNSDIILEMFGAPSGVSQSTCGASVGEPWNCTIWEYSDNIYMAIFGFARDGGSLTLNNFNIHRK